MSKKKASVSVVPQGPAFRSWCEKNGQTATTIVRDLGVSERTVYRWFSGDVKVTRAVWIALGGG